MKTKNFTIIFILFLLIALFSGLAVFIIREKKQLPLSEITGQVNEITNSDNQFVAEETNEAINNKSALETAGEVKPAVLSGKIAPLKINQAGPASRAGKIAPPEPDAVQTEQIQVKILLNEVGYGAVMEDGSSAYDLMSALKEQKKIDFKDRDYSGLGFFIEEINGVKNNPAGKNWVYYVNGQPGKVGVSYYKLKNNDVIEWKYEKKNF